MSGACSTHRMRNAYKISFKNMEERIHLRDNIGENGRKIRECNLKKQTSCVWTAFNCEISGSHGGDYKDGCLLVCFDRPDDGGSKHF
jgi:hypothetical protein